MFMPSERVWNEMKYEPVGFWPVPINAGDEYALLVKAPTNVLKAAYRSCPVSLFISTAATPAGTVVSTVLTIADDPASPLTIAGVHRHLEEQLAIEQIVRAGRALIVLFDELSRPVARAQCALQADARVAAASLLNDGEARYAGAWTSTLAEVLDEVQGLVDPALAVPPKYSPRILNVPLVLSDFQTIQIAAVGEHEAREFRLEDADEGFVLEHATWHLMESLFGSHIFHSPQVTEGRKTRELTDILAYCRAGICVVEAKAVAVLSTDPARTTLRRAKNIQKQIDKGLSQIPGAIRSIAARRPLTSRAGNPITLPENTGAMRHGIIMVSELFPSLDWKMIRVQLLESSRASGAMFHVLDPQELRLLIGISANEPVQLMLHLARRFELLCGAESAYIRTRLKGPPLP